MTIQGSEVGTKTHTHTLSVTLSSFGQGFFQDEIVALALTHLNVCDSTRSLLTWTQ